MAQITILFGQYVDILNYSTKQKGYGRQGLYLNIRETESGIIHKDVYIQDVYPNVREHFDMNYDDSVVDQLKEIMHGREFEVQVKDLFVLVLDTIKGGVYHTSIRTHDSENILNAKRFESDDEALQYLDSKEIHEYVIENYYDQI